MEGLHGICEELSYIYEVYNKRIREIKENILFKGGCFVCNYCTILT